MNRQKKFSKAVRLRKSADFRRLRQDSERTYGQVLGFQYRYTDNPLPRLGITVSKKFGKAHDRNRFKRCVREAFRTFQSELPVGIEINVFPQKHKTCPSSKHAALDFQHLIVNALQPCLTT